MTQHQQHFIDPFAAAVPQQQPRAPATADLFDPFSAPPPALANPFESPRAPAADCDPFVSVVAAFDPFAPAAPVPQQQEIEPPQATNVPRPTDVAATRRVERAAKGKSAGQKANIDFASFASAAAAAAGAGAKSQHADESEDEEYAEEESEGIDWTPHRNILSDHTDNYEALFEPSVDKLGVLMHRRKGEWAAQVKLVVQHGAAMAAGVTVGSILLAVNGTSVKGLSYEDCLTSVHRARNEAAADPLVLSFRRMDSPVGERREGEILARISSGTFSVGNLTQGKAVWHPRYYTIGGPDGTMFQLFGSKEAFHECVVGMYEQRPVDHLVETFRLHKEHRVSEIKHKTYPSRGNLFYFKLQVPHLRFVVAKFASDDRMEIERLHDSLRKIIDRARWEAPVSGGSNMGGLAAAADAGHFRSGGVRAGA